MANNKNFYGLEKQEEKELLIIPWSEQKKPWEHLGQDSFDVALVERVTAGLEVGIVLVAAGLFNTGFSVVCLPVLHLH